MYLIQDDLNLMETFNLSAIQLLFLKVLMPVPNATSIESTTQNMKMIHKLVKLQPLPEADFMDLLDRNIVVNTGPREIQFEFLELAPLFLKELNLFDGKYATDLFDTYPRRIETSSGAFSAIDCSPEEAEALYFKALDGNMNEHEEVMKDLKYGIEHRLLASGLRKFIYSKYWLYLREQRRTKTTMSNESTIA